MRIVSYITILFLILGLLPIPEWFPWTEAWFTLMWKSLVCALSVWLAYKDYKYKSLAVWNLVLIAMAVYYNPFYQFNMDTPFIGASIALIYILFLFSFVYKRKAAE